MLIFYTVIIFCCLATVDKALVTVAKVIANVVFRVVDAADMMELVKKKKVNPLRAMWPMEPALISGFCNVKRMRVFDSPWT